MKIPWRRSSGVVALTSVVESLDVGSTLLSGTPISRWRAIDQQMRRRSITAPEWFEGFWSVQPDAVAAYADLVADPPYAIGLLAMHPDGFVRQAALAALADRQLSSLLPCAVLRATDWVGPVRHDAIALLDAVGSDGRHNELLPCLGLLTDRSGSFLARRGYIAELRSEVVAKVGAVALIGVLNTEDVRCRQAAARALVELGAADDAFAAASVQDDPATLTTIVNGLSSSFWADRGNVDRALDSKFSFARSTGFFYLQRLDQEAATTVAEANLSSRRTTMRDLAQRHLAALGVDVAARYRDLIDIDHRVALLGLSETGTADDFALVAPSLQATNELERAAAVRAASRTGGRAAEALVAQAIGDESRAVAFAAGRELARLGPSDESLAQVWEIAAHAPNAQNLRAAFNVFARTNRWRQLVVALRSIEGDSALRAEGDRLLANCLRTWNRSFVDPRSEIAEEITALVSTCLGSIDVPTSELLATSLRPYLPDAAHDLSTWLDDVGSAVRGAQSFDWQRQLRAIPVLESHIGRRVVDDALVDAMTKSNNLAPICDAAAAVLRSASDPGRRAFARAWNWTGIHEEWQKGDCHTDALRESLGFGTSTRDDWRELAGCDDPVIAAGAASIVRWIEGDASMPIDT